VSSEFLRAPLSQELERALRQIATPRTIPQGAALFRQGTPAAGLYLLEKGSVRVLLATPDNRNQLLEILGPGALLGLSDSMTGGSYRITAEAAEATSAGFIEARAFSDFLSTHHEFCMQIVRLLSNDLHGLYRKFRSVSAHPGRPRRRALNEQLS